MEWISAGRAFADLGFFGVTAWLLIERRILSKEQVTRDDKMAGALSEHAKAVAAQAIATERLSGALERQTDMVREVSAKQNILLSQAGRGGD